MKSALNVFFLVKERKEKENYGSIQEGQNEI